MKRRKQTGTKQKTPGGSHEASAFVKDIESKTILLTVNEKPYILTIGKEMKASHTLAHTLRETLGLTGTKIACDHGSCCSCTVLLDGEPALSCMTLTVECDNKKIVTIEGLKDRKTGELNRLQQSFIRHSAFQCGLSVTCGCRVCSTVKY